jgi:steroid delta-isomerase-like uncharacterized protein
MSDQNKDLARRFYGEVVSTGDVDRVTEFCTADFVEHEELPPGTPDGPEGVKAFVRMYREGFPDLKADVEDMVEEGDRLSVRVRYTGTHDGDFMGIPPTHKHIDIEALDIVRIVDGKAAEHWGATDRLGLMQQIGVIPQEAGAPA